MLNPRIVASANAFAFSAFQILWITLFPWISERLGLGLPEVIAAFGAISLLFLLSAPFWSRFSDRHGRAPALLVGIFGLFLSVAVIAFLLRSPPFSPTTAFFCLAASRIVYGLTAGGIHPVSQAWQLDADPSVARAMGRHALSQNLGRFFILALSVGTDLAPLLVGPLGLFLLALLAASHLAVDASRARPLSREAHRLSVWRPEIRELKWGLALIFLFTCFLETTSFTLAASLREVLELSGQSAGKKTAELLLVCVFGAVVVQLAGRKLLRNLPGMALALGIGGLFLGAVRLHTASTPMHFQAAMVCLAVGIGWIPPVTLSLLNRGRDASTRGARAGLISAVTTLGYALGGGLAAVILKIDGPSLGTFLACLCAAMVGVALMAERRTDAAAPQIAA